MRQIQWVKIAPTSLGNTFWNTVHDDEVLEKQLDWAELERTFGIVDRPNTTKKDSQSPTSPISETRTITLLDSKKSYNISIMLSRIKMSFPEIRRAILSASEELLSEQLLKQFMQHAPTPDEVALLSEHIDEYSTLAAPEQFLIEMMKVSHYEQRLKHILFKRRFNERLEEAKPGFKTVLDAAHELTSSKKLHRLLEIILMIGNFMNSSSFRGNAYGFQIEALLKLSDVRTNDKGSFLHYLNHLIDKKFLELRSFPQDLQNVEKAAKVSFQTIQNEYDDLRKNWDQLIKDMDLFVHPKDREDTFYVVMKSFLDVNRAGFLELEGFKQEAEDALKELFQHFGQDLKAQPEEFFGMFVTFINNFEKARKENEREVENARRADELAKAETKKKDGRRTEDLFADSNRRGVMDSLISSLKTGDVMLKRSSERKEAKRISRMVQPLQTRVDEALDAQRLLEQLRMTSPK